MNKTHAPSRPNPTEVLYDLDEGIAVITLNAPDGMNTDLRGDAERPDAPLIGPNEDKAVRCSS